MDVAIQHRPVHPNQPRHLAGVALAVCWLALPSTPLQRFFLPPMPTMVGHERGGRAPRRLDLRHVRPKAPVPPPMPSHHTPCASARKKVSSLWGVMPIPPLCHYRVETIQPNTGKPAAMLGRKASGPGVDSDSGVAR